MNNSKRNGEMAPNMVEVLGIQDIELLAYFLRTSETHQMKDTFLKAFMEEICKLPDSGVELKSKVENDGGDDILKIEVPEEDLLIVVCTNRCGPDKLRKFRTEVESDIGYVLMDKVYVLLAPHGCSDEESEYKHWIQLTYNTIANIYYESILSTGVGHKTARSWMADHMEVLRKKAEGDKICS